MTGRARIATFAVSGLALLVLVLHARTYLPFLADDSLISLRYADRLLSGHGLSWTAGERVEGYSNLLWVLLIAGLGRLGLDLIVAARALGFAGMAVALIAMVRAYAPGRQGSAWPALVASLAFAAALPVAVWTVGGLEQPLVAALLAWSIATTLPLLDAERVRARDALWPGLLLGLLCLTRPDGPVFGVASSVGFALARRLRVDKAALAAMIVPSVLFVLGQLWFRHSYYGAWVPNSALAKLAFTPHRWLDGLRYVAAGGVWLLPLVIGSCWVCIQARRSPLVRARALYLGTLLIAWTTYLVSVGGDIFPGRRHLVPIVVLLCFLLAEGLRSMESHVSRRRLRWATVAMLGVLAISQVLDPEGARARAERWEWDGEVVGKLLAHSFGARQPLIAVDPAGCVPYFSRLPAIDLLGLNDKYLAHHPPKGLGQGWLGHELGDGDYVLSREPDLVLLCEPRGSTGGCFMSGLQLVANPRFRSSYSLGVFEGFDPYPLRSRIWVRREGGKLGVQRDEKGVTIPPWLLIGDAASVVRLGADGRLGVTGSTEAPAVFFGLRIDPGRWKVMAEVASDVAGSQVSLAVVDSLRHELAQGWGELTFELASPTPQEIGVVVGLPDTQSLIYGVRLRKEPAGARLVR